jgi:hypothetical protein
MSTKGKGLQYPKPVTGTCECAGPLIVVCMEVYRWQDDAVRLTYNRWSWLIL